VVSGGGGIVSRTWLLELMVDDGGVKGRQGMRCGLCMQKGAGII